MRLGFRVDSTCTKKVISEHGHSDALQHSTIKPFNAKSGYMYRHINRGLYLLIKKILLKAIRKSTGEHGLLCF